MDFSGRTPGRRLAVLLPCMGMAALASPGWAAGLDEDPRIQPFLPQLSAGLTRERFLDNVLSAYRQLAGERDSLGAADLDLAVRRDLARRRAQWMSRLWAADLDNDGRITREEAAAAQQPDNQSRREGEFILSFDRNGDGAVDFDEARQVDEHLEQGPHYLSVGAALLAHLPGRDGRLTRPEVQARAEAAFDLVDANHDTTLSREELEPLQTAITVAARPPCPLPKADKRQQVVLFSAYEGEAIATATIGGQDMETTTASVVVEPGKETLYVILASHSATIWRLSGALDRVATVVVTGNARNERGIPANGVTGIDRDRVILLGGRSCPSYFPAPASREGDVARAVVRKAIGRAPDVTHAAYGVIEARLPSGMVAAKAEPPLPAGFDPTVWQHAQTFYPGGLVAVDPAAIVAAEPAQAYDVLPAQVGLAQHVGKGTLVRTGEREFTIARPLARYPAGLTGAHSVKFLLGTGVPAPAGNPGHSCVTEEATGKPLHGQRPCR